MAGLDEFGFTPKTLDEIRAEIENDLRTKISPLLDLSTESPAGQLVGIFSSKTRELWEQLAAIYASQSPDNAQGDALRNLALLTGTIQRPATPSVVFATVNLDAGTYAAGALIAHVVGVPTARFKNSLEVVSSGGVVTGVRFEAEETGPIRANAGTLTTIAEPVAGWNSITNPEDADLGSEIESDADLRWRREQDITRVGSATVNAIRSDILALEDVVSCLVLENDTAGTVDGISPFSIECIVFGGDDDEVANAIFLSKAATGSTSGNTERTVIDEMGIAHTIRFTRPSVIEIYISLDILALTDRYPGDNAVKEFLADFATSTYGVGADVVRSRLIAALFSLPGTLDVSELSIGDAPAPTGDSNFPIGVRQIAEFDTSRIVVNSTLE